MIEPVIDISHWQDPEPDLAPLHQAGIIGVIHKATESTGYVDEHYARRKDVARRDGFVWGAYHFLRPGKMQTQAQYFVRTAGDIDLYAADHEDAGVSLDDLKEFLREVSRLTGKDQLVIYSGHVLKEQLSGRGRDEELAGHRLWLAHYTTGTPTWPTATWPRWWLWQHTDKGTIPGVDQKVDRNKYQGTADQLVADWTGEEHA
jgi:lysozyme